MLRAPYLIQFHGGLETGKYPLLANIARRIFVIQACASGKSNHVWIVLKHQSLYTSPIFSESESHYSITKP